MANLRIRVNGKFYDITCDKNNEKYVLELSKQLDSKVKQLSLSVKNVDHSRLLVLTGILLCEEIDQILKKKSSLDNPYSMNYKNQILEIKEQQKQKMQIVKSKIDTLINHIQLFNKWKFFFLEIFSVDPEEML